MATLSAVSPFFCVCSSGYELYYAREACQKLHSGWNADRKDLAKRSALLCGSVGLLIGLNGFVRIFGEIREWSPDKLAKVKGIRKYLLSLSYWTLLSGNLLRWQASDLQERDVAEKNVFSCACLTGYFTLTAAGVDWKRAIKLCCIGAIPLWGVISCVGSFLPSKEDS